MSAKKMVYVDYDKCTGCEICVMRCSLEKTSTCNPARSRIHLVRREEQGILLPAVCRLCDEPACLESCSSGALSKDEVTGLIRVDNQFCVGCGDCVTACPYGSITIDPLEQIAVVCDLCDGDPSCVDSCPTGTLQFISPDETGRKRQEEGKAKLARLLA